MPNLIGIIPTIQIISDFQRKNQGNKQNNRIDTFQKSPFLNLYLKHADTALWRCHMETQKAKSLGMVSIFYGEETIFVERRKKREKRGREGKRRGGGEGERRGEGKGRRGEDPVFFWNSDLVCTQVSSL